MSKILANQIANYGDDAPIELKEGLNIPAGRQLQADGIFGTTGQILSSDGVTIQWVTPSYFSGNYNDLTNQPTIPPAQVNVDWTSSSGVTAILNKPAVPPLPSVTIAMRVAVVHWHIIMSMASLHLRHQIFLLTLLLTLRLILSSMHLLQRVLPLLTSPTGT